MCNNCNCDAFSLCSIVGYMPVGFCCTKCELYDAMQTCLTTKTKRETGEASTEGNTSNIVPISTSIEGGLLKVVVKQKDKEIPIVIDLQKQLDSK